MNQKELKKLLHYNPRTGVFTWNNTKSGRTRKAAGGKSGNYHVITINYTGYLAHRLAFLYMTGLIPKIIDHDNQNSLDNRWCNLRSATHSINSRNMRRFKTNTSGVTGVTWDKNRGCWIASIEIIEKGVRKGRFLGRFTNKREAAKTRRSAERELGFHRNHGRAIQTG